MIETPVALLALQRWHTWQRFPQCLRLALGFEGLEFDTQSRREVRRSSQPAVIVALSV